MESESDKVIAKMLILVSILGESLFFKIVDFFVDFIQSDKEIKILMTRRLFVLHSVFEEIIDYLYEGKVKLRGRIVTNISVVLLEKSLKDANILIGDDIVLHGRTLVEEYKYLVDYCGCCPDRISAKVILQNVDKKLIKSDLLERLDVSKKVNDETWRMLSGKIVNAFSAAGQPYISYLPYAEYDWNTSTGQSLNKFVQDKECVEDITTSIQKYYGIDAYLYCDDNRLFGGNIQITQANLVRLYRLKRSEKIIVIPYSYLKPVKKNVLRSAFKKVESLHYIRYGNTGKAIAECWGKEDVHAHNRFMYSSITYLMSMALGNEFFKGQGIDHVIWKEDPLSLGFKSADCLRGREKELITCLEEFASGFVMAEKKEPLTGVFKDIFEKVKSAKDNLSQFVRECGIEDEKKADRNELRMKGISIDTLCNMFHIDAVKTIWSKAISLADAGKVTIIVSQDVINKEECIGSLLVAGEQNTTCNEENRAALALPLIEFRDFCTTNNRDFSTLKDGLIERLCSECPEIRENLLQDEFSEVVNSEIIKYRNYYLDRFSIYADNDILKEALNIEMQYEKAI